MYKDAWVIPRRQPGYHKLLCINNVRMVFNSRETALFFLGRYLDPAEGYYVQRKMTFDCETVLTMEDVLKRDWEKFLPRRTKNVRSNISRRAATS